MSDADPERHPADDIPETPPLMAVDGPESVPPRTNRLGPDLRPLRYPAYRRLFIGGVVAGLGSQLSAVAVQQQIYDITGSNAAVGIASIVALVPLVVFGLAGGAIADRHDRRTVLMITSFGLAVTAIGLWLTALLDLSSVVLVMALLAVQSGFFAVNQPTRSAMTPRLVPTELVPSANALGFSVFGVSVLAGPVLAGLLIPVIGLAWLYFIEAVLLAGFLVLLVKIPRMPPTRGTGDRATVLAGLRFLRSQPLIGMTFVIDIIAMVFGMPRALFPSMAQDTFGGPAGGGTELGLLNAGMAIGVIVGGLTSGWIGRVHRQGVAIVLAILVWGAAVIGFGSTSLLWLAVAFLAVGGWADMVSASYRSTILQTAVDDSMRGRMQGVFIVVVAGGPRVADLVHGLAADATSTGTAVVVGGVLVIIGSLIATAIGRSLWTFDTRSLPGQTPAVRG